MSVAGHPDSREASSSSSTTRGATDPVVVRHEIQIQPPRARGRGRSRGKSRATARGVYNTAPSSSTSSREVSVGRLVPRQQSQAQSQSRGRRGPTGVPAGFTFYADLDDEYLLKPGDGQARTSMSTVAPGGTSDDHTPANRSGVAQPLDGGFGGADFDLTHVDIPHVSDGILHSQFATAEGIKSAKATKLHNKKNRQWRRWASETIPVLLKGYMEMLAQTNHFHAPVLAPPRPRCGCAVFTNWPVICVYGSSTSFIVLCGTKSDDSNLELKKLVLRRCKCVSLPLRLLQLGLFPCTPCEPRLAIDLQMLEFVKGLFLRLPPNMTAWCDTLERFLGDRNYSLGTRVSRGPSSQCDRWLISCKDALRKRFGHAMHWYGVLVNETRRTVQRAVDIHRESLEDHSAVIDDDESRGPGDEPDEGNSLGLHRVDNATASPASSCADLPPSSPAPSESFSHSYSPISGTRDLYRSSSPQSAYAALQAASTNHFASSSRSSNSLFPDVSDSDAHPPPLVEDDDDDDPSVPP